MKKKKLSLSRSLIIIIAVCWIVPLCVIGSVVTLYYYRGMVSKIDDMMKAELVNLSTIISVRLDEAVSMSKKVTYDGEIDDSWADLTGGTQTPIEFRREVTSILRARFGNDSHYVMAAMYLSDLPSAVYHTMASDDEFSKSYTPQLAAAAYEITQNEGSGAFIRIVGDRIFVIRNLYSPTLYRKYGTLITELDKDELLTLASGMQSHDIRLFVDGIDQSIGISEGGAQELSALSEGKLVLIEKLRENLSPEAAESLITARGGNYEGYLHQKNYEGYQLATMLVIDTRQAHAELNRTVALLVVLLCVSLPIVVIVIYMMKRHITMPMKSLTSGYERLEDGNFGVQLPAQEMPNSEFMNLTGSFNKMSARLDYLFDYAYREKLARRDAAIIALQSRINPHFLNNTLEMMNWQARMAGAAQVSKMIEALSTLLDYSMDRSNNKLIFVSEELRCADAYFYIISTRYGQRLVVEKDIDQSLLQCYVPRLIMQPLLENAVLHGIEKKNQGTVRLKIYSENSELVLRVENTGTPLTPEVQQEIEKILTDYKVEDLETIEVITPAEEGKKEKVTANVRNGRVSIGIRNVNERIKLIYGNEYGLSIFSEENGDTAAVIRIPLDASKEGL